MPEISIQKYKYAPLKTEDLLSCIYKNRGITDGLPPEKSLNKLLPFHLLKNIELASTRLYHALEKKEKIVIIGDFDADGATSTAVAMRILTAFGATHLHYLVPNRFEFGYGLSPEIVEKAQELYQPNLILTVDNGIANHSGVDKANQLKIDVLITDHHLPAAERPLPAAIIINPNQFDDPFPSKALAGVGVIFYLMLALRALLREKNWFSKQQINEPNLAHYLDLVALGTVADLVPLDENNRILVHQGLMRMRQGLLSPGIASLLGIAKRPVSRLVSSDLAFVVAPRLNAAGRLSDMSIGIQCLLANDTASANQLAEQLNTLNQERRHIEQEMQATLFEQLSKLSVQTPTDTTCVVYDHTWHQGVIGILAARIKEKYHCPVIAFAQANETELKGSARSIDGIHIRDMLAEVNAKYPNLIIKFGGHAMAAGLSIKKNDFKQFQTAFNNIVSQHINASHKKKIIYSDGALTEAFFSLDIAAALRYLEPWGQAFPEPLFDGLFEVCDQRLLAEKHLKLLLRLKGGTRILDAIAFHIDNKIWPDQHCRFIHAVYRLDINTYRERHKLQLMLAHIEKQDS